MTQTTYYKFLNKDRTAPFSDWKWPQRKRWADPVEGPLEMCENGYHATTADHLLDWLAPTLYVVEFEGDILAPEGENKVCGRRARLVERVDTWNEKSARLFAVECGMRVLPIFERRHPGDKRPRKALRVARRYANGKATSDELAAARGAARAAAGAAARAAAWDAAWDAEKEWQRKRLIEVLGL